MRVKESRSASQASNVSNVIVVREERRIQDSVGPDNEVIILRDDNEPGPSGIQQSSSVPVKDRDSESNESRRSQHVGSSQSVSPGPSYYKCQQNEIVTLTKTVRVVTTQHDNSMVVIRKRKKGGGVREQVQKPTAIADNNKQYMSGDKHIDQMIKRRNRMRKKSSTDRKNIWPGDPEYIAFVPPAPRLDPISRLVGGFQDHELDVLPATSNKLFPTRVCRVCRKKYGRRKESRYYCMKCVIPLCVVRCFKIYHTQTNYKKF